MLTTVQVRNDLKEIRYYYSMKELFDRSSKTVKPLAIVQKVERYNTAMQNAPARLYILYVSLYIDNNTQAVLAEEWQLTTDYWNNYQVPMVYVPNHPTLAEYVFQISTFSKYPFSKAPVQLATSLILLLPVVALFCFTHKRLLGNLSIGGVKG